MAEVILVQSASQLHLNKVSDPVLDAGTDNSSGCERRSSLTLFIPTNLDLDQILLQHPPNFRYSKDCFVYILHIINSIPTVNWNTVDSEGFTAINKKILQGRIKEYRVYLDYLIARGIIIEGKNYVPGTKSRGAKFCEAYQTELKAVEITKPTLIKSICKTTERLNVERTENIHFLKKWFNPKIQIDLEGAKSFLSDLKAEEEANGSMFAQLAYNSRLLPLLELSAGKYSFGVDNTGYRLHTCLTRTMKELRQFIRYDGETLYSVDIVNSQPFLARPLFSKNYFIRNNIPNKIINPRLTKANNFPIMIVEILERVKNLADVKNYLKYVTDGVFYEKFAEELIARGLFEGNVTDSKVRDVVKEITFAVLYSPNQAVSYNPQIEIFIEIFPNVYKMLKKIKLGQGNHRAYSILLQRLEAELILDKACVRISKAFPNIPLFTVHDSIVTIGQYAPIVKNFMTKILKQNVGASPKFKIEEWVDNSKK